MAADRRWIILSPHLDDAVLSCGGLISALRSSARVEIWTIFADAPFRGPYSSVATWLHGVSGGLTGSRLIRQRRREDREACKQIGATPRYFKWHDAAYRRQDGKGFLYSNARQERWHSADSPLVESIVKILLSQLQPGDVLLAPLALGGHVDHVMVHHAAVRTGHLSLLFYSDVPYVERYPREAAWVTDEMWGARYRLKSVDVDAWINATFSYKTQQNMLESEAGPLGDLITKLASVPPALSAATEGAMKCLAPYLMFAAPAGPNAMHVAERKRHLDQSRRNSMDREMPAVTAKGDGEHDLAAVAVFAFNRLGHLKSTLASLKANRGFPASTVHVFSDGARPDRPAEAGEVAALRDWASGWCQQNGAILHEAPVNNGLRRSIVDGVTDLLKVHESVIVLEDDLVVSPAFLTFMNQALDSYRDRMDIYQICGHFVPHLERLPAIGLLRTPGSWGWATWRRAWSYYRDDAQQLLAEVSSGDVAAFDMDNSYGFLEALEKNAAGTLDTWAVRWYASVFLRGGLSVYPGRSYVRNIGFDLRGTNCGPGTTGRAFARQKINRRPISPDWHSVGDAETPAFALALESFYRWQNNEWGKPTLRERIRARVRLLSGARAGA